jgi:hypothetical protein
MWFLANLRERVGLSPSRQVSSKSRQHRHRSSLIVFDSSSSTAFPYFAFGTIAHVPQVDANLGSRQCPYLLRRSLHQMASPVGMSGGGSRAAVSMSAGPGDNNLHPGRSVLAILPLRVQALEAPSAFIHYHHPLFIRSRFYDFHCSLSCAHVHRLVHARLSHWCPQRQHHGHTRTFQEG